MGSNCCAANTNDAIPILLKQETENKFSHYKLFTRMVENSSKTLKYLLRQRKIYSKLLKGDDIFDELIQINTSTEDMISSLKLLVEVSDQLKTTDNTLHRDSDIRNLFSNSNELLLNFTSSDHTDNKKLILNVFYISLLIFLSFICYKDRDRKWWEMKSFDHFLILKSNLSMYARKVNHQIKRENSVINITVNNNKELEEYFEKNMHPELSPLSKELDTFENLIENKRLLTPNNHETTFSQQRFSTSLNRLSKTISLSIIEENSSDFLKSIVRRDGNQKMVSKILNEIINSI